MISVYGYDDYKVVFIKPEFFLNYTYNYSKEKHLIDFYGEALYARVGKEKNIIRIPDKTGIWNDLRHISVNEIKSYPEISKYLYTPKDGDVLYYHKSCTIPRIRCGEKWKRTIKLEWSNVVVVPKPENIPLYTYIALFISNESKTIYMFRYNSLYRTVILEETMEDLYLSNTGDCTLSPNFVSARDREIWADCKNAKCIYRGSVYVFSSKNKYIMDVIDGVYPKIIFEKDLMKMLDNEDEKFDNETITSIKDLLKSKDKDSVIQGMRILANLDFSRYPSIVRHILYSTRSNWKKFAPFNSAVKFMLKSVDFDDCNSINQFRSVTADEYELAKSILEKKICREINNTIDVIKSYTNIIINVDYNLSLSFNNIESKTE